jgi:3-phenylpropionate/cinnamic acid dioxygenase small subunit
MLSLQEEHDISKVILNYATGIDRRDYKLFRSCFTDDAVCDYAPNVGWSSAEAITAFMEEMHRDIGLTLHRMTNIVIAETPAGAAVRSYVDVILMWPDGSLNMDADGFYDDLMIKTEQGWKIKSRRFTLVQFTGEMPESARRLTKS